MADLPQENPIVTITPADAVKPGWKTTELVITIIVQVVGSLVQAEVFAPGSNWAKACAAIMQLGTAAMYIWSRVAVKAAA